jgi:hypothetical protein
MSTVDLSSLEDTEFLENKISLILRELSEAQSSLEKMRRRNDRKIILMNKSSNLPDFPIRVSSKKRSRLNICINCHEEIVNDADHEDFGTCSMGPMKWICRKA